jgi:hypothetical protein
MTKRILAVSVATAVIGLTSVSSARAEATVNGITLNGVMLAGSVVNGSAEGGTTALKAVRLVLPNGGEVAFR